MTPTFKGVTSILLPDDLDEHPLTAFTVELTIKNLFPRPEMEPSGSDGDHDLPPHDLAFVVCVPVVFARPIVAVA